MPPKPAVALALLALALPALAQDFNREVRPILAAHCLKCHGPDDKQRQARLRLDQSPGASKLQEALKRIALPDGDALQMPPAPAGKPLSTKQKNTLKRWVASGARYETHWAFVKPRSELASIDDYVSARLKPLGLSLQPEADRFALIRRVSLDLIGLPPTPEEADTFVSDRSPDAYEKRVDRLLASPRYGEKWARPWLDLARYADTNGYEKDNPRSIWPWRDWVINSLNADMPFDLFTVKQLAGDLLPGATLDDKIATGFHRNTMLNEEGGIDPLEFRYYAMVDRVATTGTAWLGLTVQCAQCHTHKYDPVTQKEYYRLMAFLDNAEEPELDVVTPELAKKRAEVEKVISTKEATLAESWPLPQTFRWDTPKAPTVQTASGATATVQTDGAVLISGTNPDKDTYTALLSGSDESVPVSALRLETLTDALLGASGPGRTPHGNFVLTEFEVTADGKPVKLARGEHDFAQDGFSAQAALDGKPNTGWAIQGPGAWNVNRTATFSLDKPTAAKLWTVTLRQDYGGNHTLGKFRLSLGSALPEIETKPEVERRAEAFSSAFASWKAARKPEAVRWQVLSPAKATSNLPLLTVQPGGTVFASGDFTKRDVYNLSLAGLPEGVTALRLEALPDERLPKHGPGRVAYEGPHGDFHLSTLTTSAGKLVRGVSSVGNAQSALDTNPQTGWSVNGAQGKISVAVFVFEKPLETDALSVSMVFEQYYAAGLGKFRLAVTTDPSAGKAALLPALETALLNDDDVALKQAFVRSAPELATTRAALDALRKSLPEAPTTLIFTERPKTNPRPTFVHNRGEFLQPTEKVLAGVPSVLPVAKGTDRLALARWLVSAENPLTARVVANRAWAAFFGRGIVKTTEDFGYQGTPPTHPELLDSLATGLVQSGWSQKKLHKRIVMSRTYRQSSKVSPEVRAKDPENLLLSRGARVRLDAEGVRDNALAASGLLSKKIGGPPVFPPQPASVTTEGAYGALPWTVSLGEDRYRRGLYTFSKRTAPYAMFQTFDAPSGEATCPRRESSNTPLQALALLNDPVFLEAAQALGKQTSTLPGSVSQKTIRLFRRVVVRPPDAEELKILTMFYEKQKARFASGEISADALCGEKATPERAAWTALARAVFNLDEAIVKR